jgi:hypothetical protein
MSDHGPYSDFSLLKTSRRGRFRYYGWPALLADSECFSAAAALAAFCSAFDGKICISDFRPSTQMALRNSTLPYLLKVTSL